MRNYSFQSAGQQKRSAVFSGCRGAKTFTTSVLIGYLKAKHPEQRQEYEEETALWLTGRLAVLAAQKICKGSMSDLLEGLK